MSTTLSGISGIEVIDLADLDPAQTVQSLANITQMIQEANPSLDLKRGVFHDLLMYMHSLLDSQIRSGAINRYLSARSIVDILADPTLADPDFVDAILSNFNLTRNPGASAVGEVTIVLNQAISVTIGNGTVFTANGQTYTSNAAYTAKANAAQVNGPTDRLLTQLADGNWAFTVNVTATVAGASGIITMNTLIVPSATPTAYVTSYATSDFTGGLNPETNTQLVSALQQGIAARAPSNRINMAAMLRADPSFSAVVQDSVVGAGDEEMIRDQHTIWPGSLGGRADWYIRTVTQMVQITLTKVATLVSVNPDGTGNWQFALVRDDAPGFYEVVSVLLPNAGNVLGTFPILSDTRSVDPTSVDGEFVPDILTVAEGAYTRFQTSIVRFNDTVTVATSLPNGTQVSYSVTVSMLPQIDAIQDFISNNSVRSYGADILVKAPIPCFVQIAFRVAIANNQTAPVITDLQNAVAQAINNQAFTGRLYAAAIQDVIGGYLTEGMSVGSIDMVGRIRRPDGIDIYIRSQEMLLIPSPAGTMVSPKTVQFFIVPTDVQVQISTEIPVPN